jgi:antitoxin component YwqK of YwqJK toxin-antitoxin module
MTLVKFGLYAFAVNSLKRVGTAWVARLHIVLNAAVAVTIVLAQVGYLGTLPTLILIPWSLTYSSFGFGFDVPELIAMVPPLIFAVCWAVYWAVSKRVKAKYPLNGTSELAPIWVRRRDLTPDIDRDWTRVWVLTMLLASLLTLIPWLSKAPMYFVMSVANNRGFQAAPLLYFLYPIVLLIIALVARSQTKADKFRRARVIAVLPIGFLILSGAANLERAVPYLQGDRVQAASEIARDERSRARRNARYPEGPFTETYDNGQKKAEGQYNADGYKEGPYETWYENGQLKSKRTLKGGTADEPDETWYENGQKEAECPEAYCREWAQDGERLTDVTIDEQGHETGFITEFHSLQMGGRKASYYLIQDGHVTERTRWNYHHNGQLSYERVYSDGTMVRETAWSVDGEITSEYPDPN